MNSYVDVKPHREALSQATEVGSILTIHSVNVSDTGPYSCNITIMDITHTQQTQIMVYGKHRLRTVHMCYLTFLLFGGSVCEISH